MNVVIALKGYFYNNYILKRLLCLLMCILIISFTFYVQYQEVQAFAFVLAPEAVMLIATLFVAAGIYFASDTDAQNAAYYAWMQAADLTRTAIDSAVAGISRGVATISDDIWTWVKGYFNTYTPTGQTQKLINIWSNYPASPYSLETYPYQLIYTYSGSQRLILSNHLFYNYSAGVIYSLGSGTIAKRYNYDSINNIWVFYQDGIESTPYYYTTIDQSANDVYADSSLSSIYFNKTTNNTDQINYNNTALLNDTYDFKTVSGTRQISIPATLTDLQGKTATQVQNPVIKTPPPASTSYYQNSWTGTFASNIPSGDYVFTGSGTYTGALGLTTAGEWVGDWTAAQTGQNVWTGTYTATDATTWTGTATENLPTTGQWDKTKWKVPADIIKNKFPFSIPWDLKNAVTSLLVTPQAPNWTINFPSNVFVGGGQIVIDFQQFEPWAKIIRWGVLITFNIFLILATRKIIGAGG